MKAEHRKELQTNVLADSIGRFVQSVKNFRSLHVKDLKSVVYWPTKRTVQIGGVVVPLTVLIGVLLILVATGVLAYFLFTRSSLKKESAEWVRIDQAASVDDLDAIIQEKASPLPTRDARFRKARFLLNKGQSHLYTAEIGKTTEENHKQALKDLEEATDLYQKLAEECKDVPLLAQEAVRVSAAAYVMQDKFDDAIKAYKEFVKRFPGSKDVDFAQQQITMLEDANRRKEIEDLHKFLAENNFPSGPLLPPGHPPIFPPEGPMFPPPGR